ncbi:hypothetical protein MTYP_00713 [Methylophilaceae bacterium]|nr:hypothetical protein MTYP_00713 [Methylophilaceae bacterium]
MNTGRSRWRLAASLTWLLSASAAVAQDGHAVSVANQTAEAYTQPIPALTEAQRPAFLKGRSLVRQIWVIPPSENREIAGLGPLYNRISCIACHAGNGRGFAPDRPGETMRSMLVRLSIPGADAHGGPLPHPVYGDQLNENGVPGVPGEGRAELSYTERLVRLNGGEQVSLRVPALRFADLAYGNLPDDLMVSPRIAPAIFGLGLLEAVPERTILQMAAAKKPAGIAGRVNRVWDVAQGKAVLGRFGWKANMPNLRQQIAAAFVGDMGITSPLFPRENCSPSQSACLAAPSGGTPELTEQQLDDTEFYHLALAVPRQMNADNPGVQHGARLFRQARCAVCHVPELRTGDFPRLPALSNHVIRPYTDLLLHDMGEGLADHRPDFHASGREWRTPPLWGIGLAKKVDPNAGFLHDGRARTLLEAILWHDGEGRASAQAVKNMPPPDRRALLDFLESL